MTDKTFLCVKPYLHIAEGSAVMEEGWIDYPHINIFKNSKSIALRRSRRQKPFPICVHEGYSHFHREIRLKSCTNTKFRLMKTLQMNEKKKRRWKINYFFLERILYTNVQNPRFSSSNLKFCQKFHFNSLLIATAIMSLHKNNQFQFFTQQ